MVTHSFLPALPSGTFPEITILFVPCWRLMDNVFLCPFGTVLLLLMIVMIPVSGVIVTFALYPLFDGLALTMTVPAS